jgi:DNA helicase II / ATP-dependent DNA helicase PcrA
MVFHPTPEQEAVLGHDVNRHGRILAGPGTGKSATVLAWLAQHPELRTKLLTFTRAATGELVQKLEQRGNQGLDKPSTIHSFCIAVLLRNAGVGEFPRPLRMADDWERKEIVESSLARRLGTQKRQIVKLFRELAANWESLNPSEEEGVDAAVRARFTGGWREHRQVFGYTLLSELPHSLRQALQDHPDLDGVDYDVVVVDEYQDLNACDLDVLRLLAGRGCRIVGCGDDEQSIYSFRKAHPEGIRRFPRDYAGAADYPLTVTRRCGRSIIAWANQVILGDPDRPRGRNPVQAAEGARNGQVGLLAFAGHVAEAQGVARLVDHLMQDKEVPADEILILVRSDHNGLFSQPVKAALTARNIAFSDPSEIDAVLADGDNRRALCVLRIAVHREDSLAWASLAHLSNGIGDALFDYVYERARADRTSFGADLLAAHAAEYPCLTAALARRAGTLVDNTLRLVDELHPPGACPDGGWGGWIVQELRERRVVAMTEAFAALLAKIDERAETPADLGRFLGLITPISKDIALEKNGKVRIMSLASSKGLTVKATIIAGLETGLIPKDDCDPGEERRLLYVGMTRAEEYLFGTWARRRNGPTARMGRAQVQNRRQRSILLDGGPVNSEDGNAYLDRESTV